MASKASLRLLVNKSNHLPTINAADIVEDQVTLGGRQPAAEDFRIAVAPIVGQVVGVLVEQLARLRVNTS